MFLSYRKAFVLINEAAPKIGAACLKYGTYWMVKGSSAMDIPSM